MLLLDLYALPRVVYYVVHRLFIL